MCVLGGVSRARVIDQAMRFDAHDPRIIRLRTERSILQQRTDEVATLTTTHLARRTTDDAQTESRTVPFLCSCWPGRRAAGTERSPSGAAQRYRPPARRRVVRGRVDLAMMPNPAASGAVVAAQIARGRSESLGCRHVHALPRLGN